MGGGSVVQKNLEKEIRAFRREQQSRDEAQDKQKTEDNEYFNGKIEETIDQV